jgi:hypothetical protein
MNEEEKGLSTLEEVLQRGKIYEIHNSVVKTDRKIIIFADGSQANINFETFKQL